MPNPDVAASRRARLVEVAIDMFTRYGVRRTSVEDIALEANIAKGSVYLEFSSKDQLFRAAAEEVVREILDQARAAAAGEDVLEARVTAILAAKFWRLYELVHSRPHARELVEAKDAVAADMFRAADDQYAGILSSTLAAATSSGEWRPRAPHTTDDAVAVLLRTAHGTGYGGSRLTAAAYRSRLRLAVDMVLAGAGTRGKRAPARRR